MNIAQEAKGTNGRILGSLNYFSFINEKFPQKSLLKDRTRANYFLWLGNSISKVKKILEGIDGKKIQAFFQFAVNSICSDIKKSVAKGEFADFEHRENLRNALKQLEKCGYKVPNKIYDEIKKLRRLEDFHKKIISLDFTNWEYPVKLHLEWKDGKNILYIYVKVLFLGADRKELYPDETYSKKHFVLEGIRKWSGNYKVFNSAEEGKQDLQVICTAEEVTISTNSRALLVNIEDESKAKGCVTTYSGSWSPKYLGDRIYMHNYIPTSEGAENRSAESYSNAAKHEFGHILGLEDAYSANDKNYPEKYTDIKEDLEEEGTEKDEFGRINMVMFNNGPVLNNDIEMLILAWQKGKSQYFHLDKGGKEISEALGR